MEKLKLNQVEPELDSWRKMVHRIKNLEEEVCIALVGKYASLKDAYMSIVESLHHSGVLHNARMKIKWIHAEQMEHEGSEKLLEEANAILIPGGFGDRGIEGKIRAVRYAREKGVPFLGICLGMHCAVVEFARHKLGLEGAHSSEFYPETPYPVIDLLPEQRDIEYMGGTMRLGSYPCKLVENGLAKDAYQQEIIYERHRHRYEFNNHFRDKMIAGGMALSGLSPDERLVEIVEIKEHPWFVATQFHPEFKSRPDRPHPLFRDFVGSALKLKNSEKMDVKQ